MYSAVFLGNFLAVLQKLLYNVGIVGPDVCMDGEQNLPLALVVGSLTWLIIFKLC